MAALKAHKRSVSRVMLYEIILESTKCAKCTKHLSVGASLEVEMSKKCMLLWHEAYFEGKKCKKLTDSEHFWQASGIMHLVKSELNVRFL